MGTGMIEVRGLVKSFGGRTVLDGLGLSVADGEVVTLVAGNGAGKTTCFRAVAGLVAPDAGEVLLDGTRQSSGSRRIPVAFGSDLRVTWPGRTPRAVLADHAALCGLGRREAARRIEEIADRLEMRGVLDAPAAKPSTGEAMKVTLARVLLSGHRNVVLDEPTSGLDFVTAAAMERIVEGMRADGRAVLMSSHRAEEIGRVSDRVVVMAGGRAVLDATPAEIAASSPDGTVSGGIVARSVEARA